MNKVVIISVILLLIVSGLIFISNKNSESDKLVPERTLQQESSTPEQAQAVDKQASFAIFTNGTFRVFTANMYHNLSEDVYIQADRPNIVYVKKTGVTWDVFFKTLPFSLTKDCLITGTKETFCTNQNGRLRFYLNSVIEDDLLNKEINDGDRALITYGNESEKQIYQQIDKLNVYAQINIF